MQRSRHINRKEEFSKAQQAFLGAPVHLWLQLPVSSSGIAMTLHRYVSMQSTQVMLQLHSLQCLQEFHHLQGPLASSPGPKIEHMHLCTGIAHVLQLA